MPAPRFVVNSSLNLPLFSFIIYNRNLSHFSDEVFRYIHVVLRIKQQIQKKTPLIVAADTYRKAPPFQPSIVIFLLKKLEYLLIAHQYYNIVSKGWGKVIVCLFVSLHLGGGVPQPGPDGGGAPPRPGPDWGRVPGQVQMGGGGGYPSQVQTGGYTSPRDRTADGVLDTRQAVCLLGSRSRTFLYSTVVCP